ncbi:uncharacterized protein HD556DRAFT_1235927 [Suillus plorans]|uniref:Cryptic loci regulator 2 N-terminal domain-containing protein n=1 Tax=Suillus plorans TaxID=116603 RepID=A0A9P7DJ90_9AGAM|nr:uncharacterized protein HD556DRAFT_1235927 [Suillus plorans]KAG1795158.1 hypothetical protein HD556DRAFT_1235927 [Suillus plorans]
MSARNTHKGFGSSHAIPPNPTFIDFPRSDGDPSNWPTNTTPHIDSEGHVNFMRQASLDESLSIKWRVEVAAALASKINMPQGNYVLQGWPEGYQMFDHNKGPKDSPRHDAYLIGSTYAKRFRSVPEFIPHALWLLTDPTLDRSNCNCKYCNKKPQREITASMGLLPKRGGSAPSAANTPTRTVQTPKLKRQPQPPKDRLVRDQEKSSRDKERFRPYVGVRRMPKPVRPPAPKQSMLRERNSDLSCAYGPEVKVRRWFRDGELLWCALNNPIEGPSGPGGDDSIFFWPGLVEETRMKPTPIPKGTDMDILDGPSNGHPSSNAESNGDEGVPWIIRHDLSYKMKLLGISQSLYISDQLVLPYQSVAPSDELIQAIHAVSYEDLDPDPARTFAFNPYSTSSEVTFAKAAAPYGIALQIGANISGYWTPTDDWEFKFSLEYPNSGPPQSINTFQSLDSVMNSSMAHNANLASSMATPSGSGSHTPSISAPLPPLALAQTVVQTRYQGLWWGAERIWTDELIRLKFSRGQIAPEGNDLIDAPAGPSKKAQEYARSMGGQVGGAEGRGVFMRLEGLFVADPPSGRGSKVCHAVGTLYELVDEDWEEDWDGREMIVDKGKGKAIENGNSNVDGSFQLDAVPSGLSFMNGPSPLKPPPLANPDPAIPVEGTTTDVLSHSNVAGASTSASTAPQCDANSALSHPVLSSFPLPKAPDGFKFRPILKPGHEIVVDLTWIAGRYYPGLLEHRLLDRHVERALTAGGTQLWALEGLTAGCYNAMDPTKWKPTRTAMVREASHDARVGLEEHWKNKEKERQEAKLLEGAFLLPLPPSGMDTGEGGSGLGESSGATVLVSNGDGQGFVNGEEERMESRVAENGMPEEVAMVVD